MAENDIYDNKRRYERFKEGLQELLIPPSADIKRKRGYRKYYIKNKANLAYFKQLFANCESKDYSYIRRIRLASTLLVVCHLTNKELIVYHINNRIFWVLKNLFLMLNTTAFSVQTSPKKFLSLTSS